MPQTRRQSDLGFFLECFVVISSWCSHFNPTVYRTSQGYWEVFYIMKLSFIIIFFFIIIIFLFLFLLSYGLQMLDNSFVKTSVFKGVFLSYHYMYSFHLDCLDLERIKHASSLCIITKSQNLLKLLTDIFLYVSGPVASRIKSEGLHTLKSEHIWIWCVYFERSFSE